MNVYIFCDAVVLNVSKTCRFLHSLTSPPSSQSISFSFTNNAIKNKKMHGKNRWNYTFWWQKKFGDNGGRFQFFKYHNTKEFAAMFFLGRITITNDKPRIHWLHSRSMALFSLFNTYLCLFIYSDVSLLASFPAFCGWWLRLSSNYSVILISKQLHSMTLITLLCISWFEKLNLAYDL